MGVVTGVGGRINIGRRPLEPTEKGKVLHDRSNYWDRTALKRSPDTKPVDDAIQARGRAGPAPRRAACGDTIRGPGLRVPAPVFQRYASRALCSSASGSCTTCRPELAYWKASAICERERRFEVPRVLASAELCEGRTENFAPLGDAPHFAIGPSSDPSRQRIRSWEEICPPNKNPAATFHALAAKQLKSCSSVVITLRLRSRANPNTAFSAIHGAFHMHRINQEASCGISQC